MEEGDQNPQVAPQVYRTPQVPQTPGQQSPKKWLIKYLLIGSLGGIPFGIAIGILSVFITLFLASLNSKGPESMNLGLIVAAGAFYLFGPIAWVTFLILTIFIGYRRHINLPSGEKPPPLVMELLILVMGGGAGFLAIINSFNSFQFLFVKVGLAFYILIPPLSIASVSYLCLKIFHILMRKYPQITLRLTLIGLILLFFAGFIGGRIWWLNIKQQAYMNRLQLEYKGELDKFLPELLLSPTPIATQSSQFCIQDSDCPAGLVCVGRGPTQPSVETPGVCLSQKGSQVVQ